MFTFVLKYTAQDGLSTTLMESFLCHATSFETAWNIFQTYISEHKELHLWGNIRVLKIKTFYK